MCTAEHSFSGQPGGHCGAEASIRGVGARRGLAYGRIAVLGVDDFERADEAIEQARQRRSALPRIRNFWRVWKACGNSIHGAHSIAASRAEAVHDAPDCVLCDICGGRLLWYDADMTLAFSVTYGCGVFSVLASEP